MYFQTKRLIARKLKERDFDAFNEMQSNEKVMRFILGRPKTAAENHREWQRIFMEYKERHPELLVMGISQLEDTKNNFVGTCAIVRNEAGEYELGYRFLEKYWGKGYGREILLGLMDFALKELNLDSVVAITDKDNLPSVRILESSPMKFIDEYEYGETKKLVRRYRLENGD